MNKYEEDQINEIDQLLTTKEVSDYLKIPVGTLNNWRSAGDPNGIKYIKMKNKYVRYRKCDVDSWVDMQKSGVDHKSEKTKEEKEN